MKAGKTKPVRLQIKLDGGKALLRSVIRSPLTALPGFDRKRHRIPESFHASADGFVRSLCEPSLREETQLVYRAAKSALGYVRDELERGVAEGIGSVETPAFCYTRETGLDPGTPSFVRTVRTLKLKVAPERLPESFANLFPVAFDEVSVPLLGNPDFDELVRRFETYQKICGGELNEEEDEARINFRPRQGWEWIVEVKLGELILRPERSSDCLTIIRCVMRDFATAFPPSLPFDSSHV